MEKSGKKKLYVAFIDFRKACDKINHNLLFLKLQRLGVKGLLYKNIKAIYEDLSYMIKVTGYLDPISSTRGLKQGGVFSVEGSPMKEKHADCNLYQYH